MDFDGEDGLELLTLDRDDVTIGDSCLSLLGDWGGGGGGASSIFLLTIINTDSCA